MAVDNFVAFKKLMCKRNTELNLKAMKMLDQQENEENKESKTANKEIKDKEMQDALKVAREAEKAEEEELMRKAIEESQRLDEELKKKEEEEEAEMIRKAIEMSQKEEEERRKKILETVASAPQDVIQPQNDPVAPKEEVKVPEMAPVTVVAQEPKMATPVPEAMPEPKELIQVAAGNMMSEAEKKKLEEL